MVHLSDLFQLADLDHAINEHLVVRRKHPDADLYILNYTARVQYERGLWTPVTTQCRGLIHDGEGRIVARPFRKFFNYGQAEAPQTPLSAPVVVTDKADGSLGILYPIGDGYAIATRGSFIGDQAIHATSLWRERYAHIRPPEGFTPCFEIIYPSNRIVLDYGEFDDLVLLGAVEIATGRSVSRDDPRLVDWWDGPVVRMFAFPTLADALAAEPRKNAEGLVVHLTDTDERIKLKQEDYVALHRIVTGLSEKTVWECLKAGKDTRQLLESLPDEFHGWVGEVAMRLTGEAERIIAEIETAYSTILASLPVEHTRKEYAALVVRSPYRGELFSKADGRDYTDAVWNRIKPLEPKTPRVFSEDNA